MENILICCYCSKECKNENSKRNHERLCKSNPNRQSSNLKGLTKKGHKGSNQYIKEKETGIKANPMSKEARDKISLMMKLNNPAKRTENREARRKMLNEHPIGGFHTSRTFEYNGIKLDSSYEVTFAQDLDKNNIKWERPKPLLYKLNGVDHRYYPDFYLPEYDVYVDTKNDYLINRVNPKFGITDVEKINLVMEQNKVKIYILDKNNLMWSSLPL